MLSASSSQPIINPWLLMGIFCVLLGPFTLDFHMHYPDEMFYRDAAVEMLKNGDYFTTYLGSGELRFKKPILTYWVVLAGFKMFGLNEFASRIFFLLSGAATVGLTYLLAKILFQNAKIASLSALMMAANLILILSSGRSIPDILLVLTMTISALGFAGLLRYGNEAGKKYLWLMYLGLALAFEVKGLPAAALGILGIGVLLLNPWKRVSLKKLLHWPSLLVSLVIALFWYVVMWKVHGSVFLEGFLNDQVGIRVASRLLLIIKNGFLALGLLILMLVPWIFLIIPGVKAAIRETWKENRQFFLFAVVWGLAILGMSALTSVFYERYLLPVAPVLTVLVAWIGIRGGLPERLKGVRITTAVFLFLLLVLTAFSIWINSGDKGTILLRLQGGIGVLFLIYTVVLWVKWPRKLLGNISYAFLMIFFLISSITYHISLPHQGEQAAKAVKDENIHDPIAFYGNLHAGSKIRMRLGVDYELVDLPKEDWQDKVDDYDYLIIQDKYLTDVDTSSFEIKLAARNWDSHAISSILPEIHNEDFDELLDKNSVKYYLLMRKSVISSQ